MNVFSLWNSDKMVLKMFGAQEVDARTAPDYYGLVRDLAHRAELPMPRVFVMNNPQPNAFATGRSPQRAAVAASTGLLDMLSREEAAGVIAHELAHIKNRDTLTMTVAATIGGAISMLAQYLQFGMLFGGHRDDRGGGIGMIGSLLALLVAPFAAMLVQMAISRSREYRPTAWARSSVGNPRWLASALVKIENAARRIPNEEAEAGARGGAHVHHQSADRPRYGQPVLDPSRNRENRIAALEALARELAGGGNLGGADLGGALPSDGGGSGTPGPWSVRRRARPAASRGPPSGPWG